MTTDGQSSPATRLVHPIAELLRPLGDQRWLRRLAVASLTMNIVIIFTGGMVRLTDSGLGCPTWPECTPGSYTPHAALGMHGVIEFGNRLLTFVLIAIALLTWISAMVHTDERGRPVPKLRWLTFGLGVGIPFQGVIGGITVLTDLNPYVVALHLLNSMVLVALSVWLVRLTRPVLPRTVRPLFRAGTVIIFALVWVVVSLGTIVTGSGPHAGDVDAVRTGLDPALISKVHAFAVYVLVAATIVAIILLRSAAAVALFAVEVFQGVIGFAQYFFGLPIALVALHLIGAAATIATGANLCYSVTTRARRSATVPVSDLRASNDIRSGDPRSPAETP